MGFSKVMSLWSNCAECTFLSSETWIKLYTSVRCVWVSPCARHDFWACSMSDTFTFQTKARPKNSGVNVISCLRFCFSERKWACCCSLCAPFLDSFCVFPSTFFSPHLFLLLLDTARPIPPFSPTLSAHNFPMHTTFPSSSSSPFPLFYYPSLCHTPGFITPLGVQVHSIMKDCAGQGAGLCPAQARAMGSVYSRGSYVNGACIFMWEIYFSQTTQLTS